MDQKLKKWLRWLEILKGEVQDLVVAKHIFHEVQGMIHDNPLLHQPSSFYGYLSNTYVSHVVIGVRRQIKRDNRSISMARLFQEMIDTPQAFPRAYYTEKYKGSAKEDSANRAFDKFTAPDAPHIINPNLVKIDLSRLQAASKCCEDFADKRVAHRDTRELKEIPTFNEVDACIDFLDELYCKYHLLFHPAYSMETLLPTWQDDWTSIFRVPWLPVNEEEI
ncbi:MAG: hypothetical protein Q8L56_12310 [Rhodocyclaceae bacterium]|nr:hypothetical protein [Rhodocyclaceae bacterium]